MTRFPKRKRSAFLGLALSLLVPFWACGPAPSPEAEEHDHEAEDAHVQEPGEAHDPEGEGVGTETQDPETEGASGPEDEAGPHILHVEPASVEEWGLETGPVGRTDVSAEIQLPGVLATNGNRTAEVASPVEGQIAELKTDLGGWVRGGQTLATLNAPEFTQAQAAFLQAYAQSRMSRADYERAVVLRGERAIEDREFLRRQAAFEQHLAEFRMAEVILHSLGVEEEPLLAIMDGLDLERPIQDHSALQSYFSLRTPVSGVVLQRDAVLGQHVEPGHTLFTVSDLSILWAQLDAYENQLPGLARGAEVVITTPSFPDRSFLGQVTVVANQVDPEVRTVRVRAEVQNPDGLLRPNMYVQGFLRVRRAGEEHFVLPEEAVQFLEGHHVVFVAVPSPPGEPHLMFEEREVLPGETLSLGRIILAGLNGSETVVVKGAFTLKAEMTKGAGGHDHVH